MSFDHEKLDVYQRALEALTACDAVTEHLKGDTKRQLNRASSSVVANIAEGAGEFSPAEKARFYRMARRSAIEAAAWLDIAALRARADANAVATAREALERVVQMLVRLIRRVQERARA